MIDLLPVAGCPNCRKRMWRNKSPFGMYLTCAECGGRAVSVAVLRRTHVGEYVDRIWRAVKAGGGVRQCPCPSCGAMMARIQAGHEGKEVHLDVCERCTLVWFEAGEHAVGAKFPTKEASSTEMTLKAQEALALMQLHALERRITGFDVDSQTPEGWEWVAAVLGLPVEENNPVRTRPMMTWVLVAAISAISLLAFLDLRSWVDLFGIVPSRAFRFGGATWITSFFLHGGFLHLIGNMYFLWVFGDNTEETMGRRRYALLLLLATLCGNALFVYGEWGSDVPGIGASGGISGVIAYYALRFPNARLVSWFTWHWFLFIRRILMPAWMGFVFWLILQGVGAWLQHEGMSNVNAMAHLGGAAVGVAFWAVERVWASGSSPEPGTPRPSSA